MGCGSPGRGTGAPDWFGFFPLSLRRGRRWLVADGYPAPGPAPANLTVLTGALAAWVEIAHGRATGVRYRHAGAERHADAAEVVLCAGAIGSPRLLLHSGIGPAGHLRGLCVAVAADLPAVGAGLQDHPRCTALWRVPGARWVRPARWSATARWWLLLRGPLAGNGGEAGGFLRTSDRLPAPDLQLLACPPSPLGEAAADPAVAVLVTALAVGSRGQVRLRSADPADPPLIDPAYLTDPADLEILVAGVRLAREIAAREPFARLARGELAPGEAVRDDRQLRVRGADRLRVADASVMPAVPRGNTHAPTAALAERAAELIRGAPAPATRHTGTAEERPMTRPTTVLFVLTSHGELGDTSRETGFWLAEAAHPWLVFTEAGYRVELVSIRGGRSPIDGADTSDPVQQAFLDEADVDHAGRVADTDPADYRAVLYVGGHGAMWDFPGNPDVARIGTGIHAAGGVVAAVCHGQPGSAWTRWFRSCCSRRWEKRGAEHTSAGIFRPHVVVDGRLVTGQNPPSSAGVARQVIRLLED